MLTAKENARKVAKKNSVRDAIDMHTAAGIYRDLDASNAEFADLFLKVQGRKTETGLKISEDVERVRDRALSAGQTADSFRDSIGVGAGAYVLRKTDLDPGTSVSTADQQAVPKHGPRFLLRAYGPALDPSRKARVRQRRQTTVA